MRFVVSIKRGNSKVPDLAFAVEAQDAEDIRRLIERDAPPRNVVCFTRRIVSEESRQKMSAARAAWWAAKKSA